MKNRLWIEQGSLWKDTNLGPRSILSATMDPQSIHAVAWYVRVNMEPGDPPFREIMLGLYPEKCRDEVELQVWEEVIADAFAGRTNFQAIKAQLHGKVFLSAMTDFAPLFNKFVLLLNGDYIRAAQLMSEMFGDRCAEYVASRLAKEILG